MIRRAICVAASSVLLPFAGGCGCGDHFAYRDITITEMRGVNSGAWGPIEVDTTELPGVERDRKECMDACGNPISQIRLFPNRPIKIMIVPATQPSANK